MKRQRGRGRKSNGGGGSGGGGGGQHHHHNHNRNFESNGPDIKIRGSASHVYEKYQQLARDAASAGDRVAGESYLQHAEHYFRLMRTQQQHQLQNQQHHQQQNPQAQNRPDDVGNRDFGGGNYANGRDEFEDAPAEMSRPAEAAPQPVAASPLDVVDPEAVGAASNGQREETSGGGEEVRGRRRRRRRYEGQPASGEAGGEAAEAGSPTFDNA